MCEKCDRAIADLAKHALAAFQETLAEGVLARLPDDVRAGKTLLVLIHMVRQQAEGMGVDPGLVLLRAGASLLAGVPFSAASLAAAAVTRPHGTTH